MAKIVKRISKSLFGLPVKGSVFWTSSLILVISIVLTLIYQEDTEKAFSAIQKTVAAKSGWLYILSVNVFLIFCLYLAFGQFGKIRIGGNEAKPEFSTTSWFAMLFSAGMGIGLLFWSIAEPISHFQNPPLGEAGTAEAAQTAMNVTFLHWGFHAWGIYALVGLALAYFTYSLKLPLTMRSVFYPFFGERIHGWMGDVIDILAVLATAFGLATSLGLGVKQVAAGLAHVFPVITNDITTQVLLIFGISAVATVSVILGIDKGVRFLSEMNMRVALFTLLAIIVLGPTVFIFGAFIQNTGNYLGNFLEWSYWNEVYSDRDWQGGWTIFYWGWWIAWSPFVGMFIARVSKGRTVREFILGVLIVPSLITFLWITTFGSTAIREVLLGDPAIAIAVSEDVSTALFVFFEQFPFPMVLSIIGIIMIIGFFVTSADSGSLVIVSLTSGGKIDSPLGLRIFWAMGVGVIAAVLLIGGGLQALQTASIVTGLPFSIILLMMCFSLYKGLKEELDETNKAGKISERKAYQQLITEMLARRAQKHEDKSSENKNTETKP